MKPTGLEDVEKEDNCEMKPTEEFTFEYDDFEMVEVELEEILPPPLPKHLQARKRSSESVELATLPPTNKRPRRNNRKRGQPKTEELEEITEPYRWVVVAASCLVGRSSA